MSPESDESDESDSYSILAYDLSLTGVVVLSSSLIPSCHIALKSLTFLIATFFVTEVPSFWTKTVNVPSHDQAAVAMSLLLTSSWAFPDRYWLNGVNCSCIPMLVPLSFLLDFISSDLLIYIWWTSLLLGQVFQAWVHRIDENGQCPDPEPPRQL